MTGNTAETTITMRFRNDTDRLLQGELMLPLSKGITLSGDALEENEAMLQGVAVAKDLNRKECKDTIRQQIDSGIVDLTKGKQFPTCIFPIPAKGTKKVRISCVKPLDPKGDKLNYQFPLLC